MKLDRPVPLCLGRNQVGEDVIACFVLFSKYAEEEMMTRTKRFVRVYELVSAPSDDSVDDPATGSEYMILDATLEDGIHSPLKVLGLLITLGESLDQEIPLGATFPVLTGVLRLYFVAVHSYLPHKLGQRALVLALRKLADPDSDTS